MERREFLKTGGLAAGTLALGDTLRADELRVVSITVRADRPSGELKPIWRFFGADEPNYAYMKDGKKLLAELGELRPKQVFFRAHNLLTASTDLLFLRAVLPPEFLDGRQCP